MRDKLKFLAINMALLVLSMIATVNFMIELRHADLEQERVTERCDTIVRVDTIYIEKPVVKDSIVTRYVVRCLPVADGTSADALGTVADGISANALGTVAERPAGEAAGTGAEPSANALGTVTQKIVAHSNGGIGYSQDSVTVILPIEQRTYASDQYTAWVSGYEARLDSIALYAKEVVVERELYLDKKRRRWGCVVGAGVGTNLKGVSPYVGITVGYSLFR